MHLLWLRKQEKTICPTSPAILANNNSTAICLAISMETFPGLFVGPCWALANYHAGTYVFLGGIFIIALVPKLHSSRDHMIPLAFLALDSLIISKVEEGIGQNCSFRRGLHHQHKMAPLPRTQDIAPQSKLHFYPRFLTSYCTVFSPFIQIYVLRAHTLNVCVGESM